MGTRNQFNDQFHTLWPLESISSIMEEHCDDEIERISTNVRDHFVIADHGYRYSVKVIVDARSLRSRIP